MRSGYLENAVQEAMQMLSADLPKQQILAHLTTAAETIAGGNAVCSILVLDKNGLLRNGASPKLPPDYLAAIDGLKPDPGVGTCAAVAATGKMVITTDFMADDKWAELRHLPLALGFVGAWSLPIKDASGKVLGTFGTYFREKRQPTPTEIEGNSALASIAAKVMN